MMKQELGTRDCCFLSLQTVVKLWHCSLMVVMGMQNKSVPYQCILMYVDVFWCSLMRFVMDRDCPLFGIGHLVAMGLWLCIVCFTSWNTEVGIFFDTPIDPLLLEYLHLIIFNLLVTHRRNRNKSTKKRKIRGVWINLPFGNQSWLCKIPHEWRFLARTITYFYGPFSSHVWWHRRVYPITYPITYLICLLVKTC